MRATAAAVEQTLSPTLPTELSVHALLAIDGVTIVPSTDLTRLLHRSNLVLTAPEIVTVTDTARRLFTPQ